MFQSLSRIDQMSNAAFLLVEAKSAVANLWLGMVAMDRLLYRLAHRGYGIGG